ncbi:MAG: hypothetical protein WC451_02320 [Patescibacteria group bacterium]
MVNIIEKELKKTIIFLNQIRKEKNNHEIKTPNLDDNITYLEKEFEEQRMMTSEETDKMVDWAVGNIKYPEVKKNY